MLHILYVDMNSYFASVEQQLDPGLRGRPVAVVPMNADTTSVIAASYEAKKYGVKTGTRVGDAKRMCPGLVLVTGNHDVYIKYHHRVAAAIDTVIPVEQVCSVDEFACRLLGAQREVEGPGGARATAMAIKKAIARDCGEFIKCSIGAAPNRVLAKVAADMHKPDGFTVLLRKDLPGSLFGLKLMDFPGIGPRMHERLKAAGVSTVERLCTLTEEELGRAWGSVIGREWYFRLRGEILADDMARTPRRTIGHSHVLAPDKRGEEQARAVAIRLLTKIGQRARHLGYVAESMSLHVRFWSMNRGEDAPRWDVAAKIDGVSDTTSLMRAFVKLWDTKPRGRVLKLAITLHDLVPAASATGSLFEDRRDPIRLSKAMDAINRRYGSDAVFPASMKDARKSAPRRIAFGNIPDLDVPDVNTSRDTQAKSGK